MTETAIIERLESRIASLTDAVASLARVHGKRLTRAEICERYGFHRNTLRERISSGMFPAPKEDGKWLLADVVEWEAKR